MMIRRWADFGLYMILTLSQVNGYCLYFDDRALYALAPDQLINFEIIAVSCTLALHYSAVIASWWVRLTLPVIPLLVIYSVFDRFCLNFARAPRPSDLENLPLLVDSAPGELCALLLAVVVTISAPLYLIHCHIKATPRAHRRRSYLFLGLRALIALTLLSLLNRDEVVSYHKERYRHTSWREEKSIQDNGRLSSLLYYRNQERAHARQLKRDRYRGDANACEHLFPSSAPISRLPNIYIIIMESWVDPRRFTEFTYTPSPLAEELKPYLLDEHSISLVSPSLHRNSTSLTSHNLGFSVVKSPVYGGGTAQAEFELLTGTPALAEISAIDFNVMRGHPAPSLIRYLRDRRGYQVQATIGTGHHYFNARQAYQSLGLDQVIFLGDRIETAEPCPEGCPTLERAPGDEYLFDGDLFDFQLRRLRPANQSINRSAWHKDRAYQPMINYIVGMYGHAPFHRNTIARPDVIEVKPHHETLHHIANQFYYRTRALGHYLSQLSQSDPHAMIYITSDHLPAFNDSDLSEALDKNNNISLLRLGSNSIDVSGHSYHEVARILWSLVSKNKTIKNMNHSDLRACYYNVISRGFFK